MAKATALQHGLKFLFAFVLAIAILDGGGIVTDRLVASQSAGLRWLGAAAAVVTLLPWLGVIAWPLMHLDEYHRRTVVVGTAVSFVVDLLVHTAFNVIVDAHLVSPAFYLPALP